MSFISQNLNLPYIAPAQAQKHVTHNEALRALDAIVHLSLVSKSQTTPPAAPVEGTRYFVATTATDAWTGHDGQIAAYQDGAWAFYVPQSGWQAWIEDESISQVWGGTQWQSIAPIPDHQNLEYIGVNTTADTTNRLAVSSPATLLNHEGNGHQLKLNKNAASDTATVLYQSNWSGRAEIGLAGDDDFHFKISADGSVWNDMLVLHTGGDVSLGKSNALKITEDGKVGIGTNNPNDYLNIDVTDDDGYVYVRVENDSTNNGTGAGMRLRSGTTKWFDTYITSSGITWMRADGALNLRTDNDDDITFQTGGSEVARFDHSAGVLDLSVAVKTDSYVETAGYTVSTLPSANTAGRIIYVSDETGGAVLAFSDGTNWRRVTDRAVVA